MLDYRNKISVKNGDTVYDRLTNILGLRTYRQINSFGINICVEITST